MESLSIVVSALKALYVQCENVRTMRESCASLRRVVGIFLPLLVNFREELPPDGPEPPWLPALADALRGAAEVVYSCSRKPVKTRVFPAKYAGRLEDARTRIRDATEAIALSNATASAQARGAVSDLASEFLRMDQLLRDAREESRVIAAEMERAMRGGFEEVLEAIARDKCGLSTADELQRELAEMEAQCREELKSVKDSAFKRELEVALSLSRMAMASTKGCPDDFRCPITLELMVDPHILVQSGHTYEKKAIQHSLIDHPGLDPFTNQRFEGKALLVPNHSLRRAIEQWRSDFSQAEESNRRQDHAVLCLQMEKASGERQLKEQQEELRRLQEKLANTQTSEEAVSATSLTSFVSPNSAKKSSASDANLIQSLIGQTAFEELVDEEAIKFNMCGRLVKLSCDDDEIFDVSYHETVNGPGFDIKCLGSLIYLQELDLCSGDYLGDINNFGSMQQLRKINLSETEVSGDIKCLQSLHCLTSLQLSFTRVSGNICHLASLESLVVLELESTHVVGDIRHLSPLVNLTSLDLGKTRVVGDADALERSLVNLYPAPGGGVSFFYLGSYVNSGKVDNKPMSKDKRLLQSLLNKHIFDKLVAEKAIEFDGEGQLVRLSICDEDGNVVLDEQECESIYFDIENLSQLRQLELIGLPGTMVYGDIQHLSSLSNLSRVGLSETDVSGSVWNIIGLKKLEILKLDATKVFGDKDYLEKTFRASGNSIYIEM